MEWSGKEKTSPEEIIQQEKDKGRHFDKIRIAASCIDNVNLKKAILEAKARYGSLPDVEYAMLGGSEYGFFYTLVEAFFTAINDAQGDMNIVENLKIKFRECCHLLYSNNILPDVKTLSSWTALSTGTLKSPYMFKVFNNNQQLAPAENSPNITPCITDLANAPYPLYMPYLEYTPEQRVFFDEFVHYMSYVQEMSKAGRKIGPVLAEYMYADIKDKTKKQCADVDESLIEEKALLDEMNVRLAQRFDYYLKCKYYTEAKLMLDSKYSKDDKFIGEEQRNKGVLVLPSAVYNGKAMDTTHMTHSDSVILTRGLLRMLGKIEGLVALRMGFALTSPLTMFTVKTKSLSEKLRLLDEYYEFKKSMFVPGAQPLKLKSDEEIANIQFPSYASLLHEEDCPGESFTPFSVDRSMVADDENGNFEWLVCMTTAALGRYTLDKMYNSRYKAFDHNLTLEEIKNSLNIPKENEPYEGPCL